MEHHREARDHLDRAWSAWHAVGPGVAMTGLILWPRLGLADTAEEAIECARLLLAPENQPLPAPLADCLTRALAAADPLPLIAEALALAPSYRLL